MPPRTRRTTAAAKKAAREIEPAAPEKSKLVVEEPILTYGDDEQVVAVVAKPLPSFQIFNTSAKLKDGLCIVRELANGEYELVTLSSEAYDDTAFGSKEFGDTIRDEQSGERLKLWENVKEIWKGAEFRVGQAVSSAKLRVFRFLELPIELRYRVYEMTVCSTKLVRPGSYEKCPEEIIGCIHLRGTCRQVFDESKKFFWRNNFKIVDFHTKMVRPLLPLLTENLRELTWTWTGYKIKDTQYLRMLKSLVNLKIFNLRITSLCIRNPRLTARPITHEDEPAVAKFKNTPGFNELFELRGLENVTVKVGETASWNIRPSDLSDEERQAFEAFWKSEVTKPRDPPKVSSKSKTVKKATAINKKRKSFAWMGVDDDDFDDEDDHDYMPARARRRR